MVNVRKNPLGAWERAPYLGRHFPLRRASSRLRESNLQGKGVSGVSALPCPGGGAEDGTSRPVLLPPAAPPGQACGGLGRRGSEAGEEENDA